MKKLKAIFLMLSIVIISFASWPINAFKIGIIQTTNHLALDATKKGIQDKLRSYFSDIEFLSESAQGDLGIAAQITQKFINSDTRVIITIGTLASQAAKRQSEKNRVPLVFSSVTDPLGAGLVKNMGSPEGSITGVSNFIPLEPQLKLFKRILPHLKRLGVIYNPSEMNSLHLIALLKEAGAKENIEIVSIGANRPVDVAHAAQKIISDVEAIFITNDNTALSALSSIVRVGRTYKKPIFCSDTDMIDLGAIAALGVNQYKLGEKTADLVMDILSGHEIEDLPVAFSKDIEMFINLEEAKKIDLSISPDILSEATKVKE